MTVTPETVAPARPLKILGHRGARGIAPENTLAGFQAGIDAGIDMIELDVHLSKDGELVVMHDPRVERTTDGSGLISDMTLAEIKRLNAAAKFTGKDYGVERVPTLQEAYDFVAGRVGIQIEIKTRADGSRYPGIEEKVVDLLRRNHAVESGLISSFDFPTLEKVHELEPRLARYAIVSTNYFKGVGSKGPEGVVADLQGHGFGAVAVEKTYLSEALFSQLKQAGFTVGVWVINDVQTMEKFAHMGVDFMTSDRPDILVPAYRKLSQ